MSRSGAAYLLPGQAFGGLSLTTGNYYRSPNMTVLATAANPADGTMRLSPLWVSNPGGVTLTRIACETVTTAAAANGVVRLGIYNAAANGLPGALLLDAGTVDSTVTPGVLEITISQVVGPGIYWLAAANQGNPATAATMRTLTVGLPIVGRGAVDTVLTIGTTLAGITGALPGSAATALGTSNPYQVAVKV